MGVLSALAAILLPAIGTARETARRVQCVNNLRQIGIALHSYHSARGRFPAGYRWEPSHQSAYGWAVSLLPYLGHDTLYQQTDRQSLLESTSNQTARSSTLPTLLCPSDITSPQFLLTWKDELTGANGPLFDLPTASYFGVFGTHEPDAEDTYPNRPVGDGTFLETETTRLQDLSRGSSNTIIVGERTMARIPGTWLGIHHQAEDGPCRLLGNAETRPNCDTCDECEFDSRHPGGANFLWADGSSKLISHDIETAIYRRMSQR